MEFITPALLPLPFNIAPGPTNDSYNHAPDVFLITRETWLSGDTGLEHILQSYAEDFPGIRLSSVQSSSAGNSSCNVLQLSIQSSSPMPTEGYVLHVTPSVLNLASSTTEGLFRGLQTLRQLLHQYGSRKDANVAIPCMNIEDHPHYAYRGLMLDVGRHFFDVTEIKRVLDLCALLKLNIFHWHLTEDQGWRIEVPEYPKLTEIGSRRGKTRKDKKPVTEFYTQDQIRDVVQYATDRFMTVIPEIDLPGHIRSAIAAYPHLGCTGEPVDVATRFGIFKEILCAGQDTTLQFLKDILDVVCRLFPGPWVHLGGDEAPKHHWRACPHCQRRLSQEGLKNEHELQGWLTNRMAEHVKQYGKKVIVWNDSLKAGNLSPDIAVQFWLEGRKPDRTPQAVNKGRMMIASDFFHLYFDYPYGMTPLKKTYAYDPVLEGMTEDGEKNLLGVEAALWTELVDTTDKLERLMFPRLAAMAEVGWCGPVRDVSHGSVRGGSSATAWSVSGNPAQDVSGSPDSLPRRYKDFSSRLPVFLRLLAHFKVACTPLEKADIKRLTGILQTVRHFARMMTFTTSE